MRFLIPCYLTTLINLSIRKKPIPFSGCRVDHSTQMTRPFIDAALTGPK
jgi:hypothetical protein